MATSECETVEYLVSNVPRHVDAALRRQASNQKRPLNEIVLEALAAAAGIEAQSIKKRDLSDLAGTWVPDPKFDEALAEMDQIDPDMWA